MNHDNSSPDIEKDLELARQLLADGHLSPLEHQAKPMEWNGGSHDCMTAQNFDEDGVTHCDKNFDLFSGNFRGWIQHRQLIGGANNG